MQKTKIAIILLSTILMLSMTIAIQPAVGDSRTGPGTHFDTFAFLNVFPNPAGVGQSVTLGIFLSSVFPVNVVAQISPLTSQTQVGPLQP